MINDEEIEEKEKRKKERRKKEERKNNNRVIWNDLEDMHSLESAHSWVPQHGSDLPDWKYMSPFLPSRTIAVHENVSVNLAHFLTPPQSKGYLKTN